MKFVKRSGLTQSMTTLKYVQGPNACGNCQSNRHRHCRPRLDGTLCSCSCDNAETVRNLYDDSCRIAESKGQQLPTIVEALSHAFPGTCRTVVKNLHKTT